MSSAQPMKVCGLYAVYMNWKRVMLVGKWKCNSRQGIWKSAQRIVGTAIFSDRHSMSQKIAMLKPMRTVQVPFDVKGRKINMTLIA